MTRRFYQVVFGAILIILIGVLIYFAMKKPTGETVITENNIPATTTPVATDSAMYVNSEYGFTFTLPKSWEGYSVIEDVWQGDSIDSKGQVVTGTYDGPVIYIRHPDWEYKSPRQDIPIMVFTLSEWSDIQADKFHIGAAPINPSEIGRSSKYVFAIPARYNFEYLTGYEEVEEILQSKPLKTL